jgi:nucleoside 2-deoxyribosyltransferase
MPSCPVCKQLVEHFKDIEGFKSEVQCNYCGEFVIEKSLQAILDSNQYNQLRIGSWIREQNSSGITPELNAIDFANLISLKDKKINQKYELLLKYVYSEKTIQIQLADLNRLYLVLFWCEDIKEFNMLLSKAVELNHLKLKFDGMSVKEYIITYDGKEFIENLGLDNNSNKIFMAFHFTEEMKKEFESTIKRAVIDSSEGKLEAVRVSSSATDHDAKIDDELIGMIKSSKAVIADFTGNRTAVYYEAGFAMGLGIPVIWTCKDENIIEGEEGYGKFIDKEGKERFKKHIDLLSFDTRQYPHILWKNEEDLYKQVVNRLKAKIL